MNYNFKKYKIILLLLSLCLFFACPSSKSSKKNPSSDIIMKINSTQEFETLVKNSGKKLLVFDLYADWCGPCKVLSPILETLSHEYKEKAAFYKVNIDEQTDLAKKFNPNFTRNELLYKTILYSMIALVTLEYISITLKLVSEDWYLITRFIAQFLVPFFVFLGLKLYFGYKNAFGGLFRKIIRLETCLLYFRW